MKIMIIGDSASGKSTFAQKLGNKLSIPVIHIDQVNDIIGRSNSRQIESVIVTEAEKANWIIDGNGFTKDKDFRIRNCDLLIVFNANPFVTIFRHIKRTLRNRANLEKRVGSENINLNLKYFIPYVFFKFPARKHAAIQLTKSLGKKVVEISDRRSVNRFLESFNT